MSAVFKTVELIINSEDAQKKLDNLNRKLVELREKKEEAIRIGNKTGIANYTKEIANVTKKIKDMETRAVSVRKTIESIDKASPKQLKDTIRQINKEINSGKVERGSKEYMVLQEQMRRCTKELGKIREETAAATSMSGRLANWANKWMGVAEVLETAMEVFSEVKQSAMEAVTAFAELDEAMESVRKYTGLAKEEVKGLNKEFDKFNTRTTRIELNELAADAGRLGITSKRQILEFVEAANMINVALGEDLGKDAVKNIGKIAQLFGEDKARGLKDAMIATGSVINELAQTSSASEGYIVDFSSRLASMAKQAGITQAQIMGLASVMDQSMVNSEEASTALNKIIQKMFREPEKLAQAAGLNVKKFTKLVGEDANQALLRFAWSVSKLGGMEKIAPMLGDLSLTGAGVSKAMNILADRVDMVRKVQAQATAEFERGTSVINEYNIANNTVQAGMEKAKSRFQDLRAELGEELMPLFTNGLHLTSNFIEILKVLLEFANNHKLVVLEVTAALGYYAIALNMVAIKAKLVWVQQNLMRISTLALQAVLVPLRLVAAGLAKMFSFVATNTKLATYAQKQFNLAVKKNPLGLFLSLLATGIAYLLEYKEAASEAKVEQDSLNASQQAMIDMEQSVIDRTAKKITLVKKLAAAITDSNRSISDRQLAIAKLKELIPEFDGSLEDESHLAEKTNKAVKGYLGTLEAAAKAQAAMDQYSDIEAKKMSLQNSMEPKEKAVFEAKNEMSQFMGQYGNIIEKNDWFKHNAHTRDQYVYSMRQFMKGDIKDMDDIKAILNKHKELQEKIDTAEQAVDEDKMKLMDLKEQQQAVDIYVAENKVKFADMISEDDGKTFQLKKGMTDEERKALEDKAKAKTEFLKSVKKLAYVNNKITYEQYQKEIYTIEEKGEINLRNLQKKGSLEWNQHQTKAAEIRIKKEKFLREVSIKEIDLSIENERNLTRQKYRDGVIDEEEYEEEMSMLTLKGLRERVAYYERYYQDSKEMRDAQSELEKAELEYQIKEREKMDRQAEQMKSQYFKKTLDEQKDAQLEMAQNLHLSGALTDSEYFKMIDEIEAKFKKLKEEEENGKKGESPLIGSMDPMSSSVIQLGTALDNLHTKIQDQKANWEDYAAVAQAALGSVMAITQSASNLMQANIAVEQAKIEKRYEAEIKAAGKNRRKVEQLEKKKQAEIAKMKNKYASKAMAMEIAGAVAQTAVAAINAYASASKVSWVLGPIAASMAVAAGMMQIATIKKQHQAQETGYYSGGFTGGRDYKKKAGIVHEGEFVANHAAVNNPNVRPYLNLIDYAQRNNTISSITQEDMVGMMPARQEKSNTVVQVVDSSSQDTAAAIDKLNGIAEKGIKAYVVIDGEDGLKRQMDKYNNLTNI